MEVLVYCERANVLTTIYFSMGEAYLYLSEEDYPFVVDDDEWVFVGML